MLDGLMVANVDAFTAFVDDPWTVGEVAAQNALSDVLAKGVDPTHAMAIVTVPEDRAPEDTLAAVMAGVRRALDAAGVQLLGGHTMTGPKLTVGLSVWAHHQGPLWALSGAVPGDVLVNTRPLGTGVLFHADMAGQAPSAWREKAAVPT